MNNEILISLSSTLLLIIIFIICYLKLRKKNQSYISIKQKKKSNNKPLMICGPSGVGKDTLISMLMKKYPTIFIKSISHITREPRKNEKEGINYIFISKEKFLESDKNKEFLLVFEKYNNFYGTSKQIFNNSLYNDNIVLCDFNIELLLKFLIKKKLNLIILLFFLLILKN